MGWTPIYDPDKPEKGHEGGTRKIGDLPKDATCRHPGHNPPSHRVFEPGIYEHVCPNCGARCVFTVPAITC